MLISQCVGCRIMTASAFRLVPHEHQFHCAVLSASTSRGNEGWIHSTKRSVCLISQKQPADLLILPNVYCLHRVLEGILTQGSSTTEAHNLGILEVFLLPVCLSAPGSEVKLIQVAAERIQTLLSLPRKTFTITVRSHFLCDENSVPIDQDLTLLDLRFPS